MKNIFKTINEKCTVEIVEKKSRFIASISPVKSEEEAINFINSVKKKYYDARHNCFAYVINADLPIVRFSDDREPSGTAGKPMLDVLLGENLQNIVVVVTRYFGGVLLGTGGLVRAYGKAVKESVLASKIVEITSYNKVTIISDYFMSGKIQYEITKNNYLLVDTIYTDIVTFVLYIKYDLLDSFEKDIINLTNNTVKFLRSDKNELLKIIDGKIIED